MATREPTEAQLAGLERAREVRAANAAARRSNGNGNGADLGAAYLEREADEAQRRKVFATIVAGFVTAGLLWIAFGGQAAAEEDEKLPPEPPLPPPPPPKPQPPPEPEPKPQPQPQPPPPPPPQPKPQPEPEPEPEPEPQPQPQPQPQPGPPPPPLLTNTSVVCNGPGNYKTIGGKIETGVFTRITDADATDTIRNLAKRSYPNYTEDKFAEWNNALHASPFNAKMGGIVQQEAKQWGTWVKQWISRTHEQPWDENQGTDRGVVFIPFVPSLCVKPPPPQLELCPLIPEPTDLVKNTLYTAVRGYMLLGDEDPTYDERHFENFPTKRAYYLDALAARHAKHALGVQYKPTWVAAQPCKIVQPWLLAELEKLGKVYDAKYG